MARDFRDSAVPTCRVDGVEFPTSIHPTRADRDLRYVQPPTSSRDWMGAEWESPVSLTFQTEVATAETLGSTVNFSGPDERDVDADWAFHLLHRAVRTMAAGVRESGRLVDPHERVRISVGDGQVRFRAKVWPAIAGVTYYAKDDTR